VHLHALPSAELGHLLAEFRPWGGEFLHFCVACLPAHEIAGAALRNEAAAIALSFCGVLVLGFDSQVLAAPQTLVLMLVSAFFLALGTVLMRGLTGMGMIDQQGWTAACWRPRPRPRTKAPPRWSVWSWPSSTG